MITPLIIAITGLVTALGSVIGLFVHSNNTDKHK